MRIGIIGYGEIGQATEQLYSELPFKVLIHDPLQDKHDDLSDVELLYLSFPFGEKFIANSNEYISRFRPKLTIVNSTVRPGTTKSLLGPVAHCPVRGTHPNLVIGMRRFLRYIGSENKDWALMCQSHFELLGIESYICKDSLTSEYAKLLDTTYYGICIAFHSEVAILCEELDLDFNEVMTIYNNSYNEGYAAIGKLEVVRPVLSPTKKIGGHCIIPNADILIDTFNNPLIDGVLKFK